MNCLEFRRRCTVDPSRLGAECAAHRRRCAPCGRFAVRMGKIEKRLRAAVAIDIPDGLAERIVRRLEREGGPLTEECLDRHLGQAVRIEVPEGLAGRVLLRQSFDQQRRNRRQWIVSVALAASLAVAVGLTSLVGTPGRGDGLGQEVITHIEHEPQALLSRAEVPELRLAATLADLGMTLDGDIGRVTYAGLCEIGPVLGAHLVVAGEHGPITIIVLPEKTVQRVREFESDRYRGILLPAGRGSIAVVAEYPQLVTPTAQRIGGALRRSP